MVIAKGINSLENYIHHVRDDRSSWGRSAIAWFRGEPSVHTPLLPKVYRLKPDGGKYDENQLLQMFRIKAQTFAHGEVPAIERTDQWLFLGQHVGLPTRLLDWTESALLALYFALPYEKPVVWMLNPIQLNALSVSEGHGTGFEGKNAFPLTWFVPEGKIKNIGVENIKSAWEPGHEGLELPIAIHPTYLHQRMSAQRSVFTVHGHKKQPLHEIVPEGILRRYDIDPSMTDKFRRDLQLLGINVSTAFPDLDGLARELSSVY